MINKIPYIISEILDISDLYDSNIEVYSYFNILVKKLKQQENLFNKCLILYTKEGNRM
jgi:hypothetical protein